MPFSLARIIHHEEHEGHEDKAQRRLSRPPHTLPHVIDRPPGGEGQERLSVFLRFVIFMCFMVRDGLFVNKSG
jgi:hypothetical protein